MTTYAADTKVSSDRTRAEIERTLVRYGASGFLYGWQSDSVVIAFTAHGRQIRFVLPMPDRDDRRFTHTPEKRQRRTQDQIERHYEQAVKSRWRSLLLIIKAKLEAVESGIVTFVKPRPPPAPNAKPSRSSGWTRRMRRPHVSGRRRRRVRMVEPYYADESVTLYNGDCREITAWLEADVLVTDPPYGRGWRQGDLHGDKHAGIAGDLDTAVRDAAFLSWGDRPAIAFGDLMLEPPQGTKQVLVYAKPVDSGVRGAMAGFRRDAEAIYIINGWPSGIGGESSVLRTAARMMGGAAVGLATRYRHPHAKPVDVMERLLHRCPPGIIADPFAGSGSTLVAARNLGRQAIGVEIEERYCEIAAKRLAQGVLEVTG